MNRLDNIHFWGWKGRYQTVSVIDKYETLKNFGKLWQWTYGFLLADKSEILPQWKQTKRNYHQTDCNRRYFSTNVLLCRSGRIIYHAFSQSASNISRFISNIRTFHRIRIEGFYKPCLGFHQQKNWPKESLCFASKIGSSAKVSFMRFHFHSIKINLACPEISKLDKKDNSDRVVSIFGIQMVFSRR